MSIKLALIAAVAENGVMGKGDWLPWEIKSEFQYFKKTTMGYPIIFGRKTLETLGKPLPGRLNIIVTRDTSYQKEGAVVTHRLEDALTIAKDAAEKDGKDQVFIGGGAEIYKLALPVCDRLYLTEVHMKPEGDTIFPAFDRSEWVEVKREFHKAKEGESADYTITVLERAQ
ncbi:MAG TPA: dihydrofolate reductase [Patescibacteria group bacterium]|nr:dihydrofolate reductase [Patescibacteria group bacterium]